MLKSIIAAVALVVMSAPGLAQDNDNAVRRGSMLRDAKGMQVGTVDRVLADGSIRLIIEGRIVTVPATSITVENRLAKTSLTRTQIARLK